APSRSPIPNASAACILLTVLMKQPPQTMRSTVSQSVFGFTLRRRPNRSIRPGITRSQAALDGNRCKIGDSWPPSSNSVPRNGRSAPDMQRRHFLVAAAAFPAIVGTRKNLLAAGYDLVIRGGRVIDPSQHLDTMADVAVRGGKIAAVQPKISDSSAESIDAHGK